MERKRSEVDVHATIRWVEREEYVAYFKSLSPEDRWTHPGYPDQKVIWHWEERRWWALEEET